MAIIQVKEFEEQDGGRKKFGNIFWIHSLFYHATSAIEPKKNFSDLKVIEKYDNYNALNIDKLVDIPKNYYEPIGVPITYLRKHNPKWFEILGLARPSVKKEKLYGLVEYLEQSNDHGGSAMVNGKEKFTRVFIKRKKTIED